MPKVKLTKLKSFRQKIKSSTVKLGYTLQALVLISATVFPVLANAESDTGAPQLTGYERLTPYSIDTSTNEYTTVTIRISLSDDLSGVGRGEVAYVSSTGEQDVRRSWAPFLANQTFVDLDFQFPQYSENGDWQPFVSVWDNSGNYRSINPGEISQSGYPDNLVNVSGTEDTASPQLLNLHTYPTTPATFDISSSAANHSFGFTVNDNLSPDLQVIVTYTAPSGNQNVHQIFENVVIGTSTTIPVVFPRYSEAGVWKAFVQVRDRVQNLSTYTREEMMALGMPDTNVTLTGTGDTQPPIVTDINFGASDGSAGEPPLGSAAVTVNMTLTDNLSGVDTNVTKITYIGSGQQTFTINFTRIGLTDNYTGTTFLPPHAATGGWTPVLEVGDNAGNQYAYNDVQLTEIGLNMDLNVNEVFTENVTSNTTVSTDTENDGATPDEPVEVGITTPNAGGISIVTLSSTAIEDESNDFTYLGNQVSINAPSATASNPLVIDFRVDASKIPADLLSINLLNIKRNNVIVSNCNPLTSTATPDPCVANRELLADGDVKITVRTSEASIWGVGFSTPGYSFESFLNPVKNNPILNQVNAGSTVPVKFSLGGNYGLDILVSGYPVTQPINCGDFSEAGSSTLPTMSNQGLKFTDGHYQYNWKTNSSWANSCRQFVFKFTNGETAIAYFKIK